MTPTIIGATHSVRNSGTSNGDDLAQRLQGELIRPGDEGYDMARSVWNGMIDRHPALIVRCKAVNHVIAALHFAREHKLPLAVRGGGHNVAGHGTCDGGLVIDLSPMKQVVVDPQARTALVGGGATWADLDAATQPYGLATPGGVVSVTGVAGLTLGGGYGWLRNKYGLTCDNLLGAEVVTADGRVVHTGENEHPDLLWGLRGGGGNFGIVTTFEFRLHPVGPQVMFAFAFHNGDKMHEALHFYREYMATAPDEVSTLAVCGIFPPGVEAFPVELHGQHYVLFCGMYAGAPEDGQRILQPLIDFSRPLVDFSGIMPYSQAQTAFDADYPDGMRYYWKSLNVSTLDDQVIDRIVEHARRQPSAHSTTDIWQVGGAVRRLGAESSAFHGRQAAFLINPEANWEDPADDQANMHWVRSFIADLEEFSDGSRYLNFAGFQEEGEQMMRQGFGDHYARLAQLKKKYDPANLFKLNQNVAPAS